MGDGSEKIIRWLREEGISPRPVSDQKCDFSYAVDRLFGTSILLAIAKPRNGTVIVLQSQFVVPSESKKLAQDHNETLHRLHRGLLNFDISDYSISEKSETIDRINLICYVYHEDLTKQFLFDSLRKLKRVNSFLDLFFRH